VNVGRVVGIILVVAALIVCVLGGALSLTSAQTGGGRVVGLALSVVLAAPLAAVGVFLIVRGQREAAAMAVVRQQKKLLGMIHAQGRVSVGEAALELDVSRDRLKEWVYDLVNKRLFTGYVNWDDGDLISVDAAKMDTSKCPRCGGAMELVGKGVVECPYCGTEIFLS